MEINKSVERDKLKIRQRPQFEEITETDRKQRQLGSGCGSVAV